MVLEGTTLSFYQDEKNTSPVVGQENVEKLRLAGDSVLDFVQVPEDKSKLVLLVKGGGDKAFCFSCDGGRDNDEWIERIQETIESIKRRSEHELGGFLPGQSSVMSTPTTRGGGEDMGMERGTPASEGRLQMSAPSLPPSERGRASFQPVQAPPPSQTAAMTVAAPIVAPHLVPLPTPSSSQKSHTLHLPHSSSTRTPPTNATSATQPQAPLAQHQHPQSGDGTSIPLSASQLPTPWGDAAEDAAKMDTLPPHMHELPPTPHLLKKEVSFGGGAGGGDWGGGAGLDETTCGMFAATLQSLPVFAKDEEGKVDKAANTTTTTTTAPVAAARGGLTLTALEGLAGTKRMRPSNPEREDMISMEERKQRVEEGMRRTASRSHEDARIAAEERAEDGPATPKPDATGELYHGWVKMLRRKWYMVLLAPTPPSPAPTSSFTTGLPLSPSGGKTNFPRLALYVTPADLHTNKPPKETIVLTADCIVESRRLPIAATNSGSSSGSSSSGGRGMSGHRSSSSFTTPSTGGTAASFSEVMEPDSVVDLLLTSSRTGMLKTITLQCFTVEEENRWISEIQQAIGALMGDEEYDGSPGFLGLSRELSEHVHAALPQVCCTIS